VFGHNLDTPPPPDWEVLADDLHADCVIFDVRRLRCRHPEHGAVANFFALGLKDWAVAFAATPGGEFVVIQQFRFGTRALSWEIPAGVVDPPESPEAAAARELKEETGYEGEKITQIGWVHPNPALHGNRCFFYLVEGAHQVAPPNWESYEELRLTTSPLADVWQAAQEGQFSHGMVQAGLFFLGPIARERGWL